MATILLVEDAPEIALEEAHLLHARGYTVLRCWGGATQFAACPMMRGRPCALGDAADLIVFGCGMIPWMAGRSYRGVHIIRAYRAHPFYGRLPMLVTGFGIPERLEGSGPIACVPRFSSPEAVVEAALELLETSSLALRRG